jgi:hypothetical protein
MKCSERQPSPAQHAGHRAPRPWKSKPAATSIRVVPAANFCGPVQATAASSARTVMCPARPNRRAMPAAREQARPSSDALVPKGAEFRGNLSNVSKVAFGAARLLLRKACQKVPDICSLGHLLIKRLGHNLGHILDVPCAIGFSRSVLCLWRLLASRVLHSSSIFPTRTCSNSNARSGRSAYHAANVNYHLPGVWVTKHRDHGGERLPLLLHVPRLRRAPAAPTGRLLVFCSYGDVPCPPKQTGGACHA